MAIRSVLLPGCACLACEPAPPATPGKPSSGLIGVPVGRNRGVIQWPVAAELDWIERSDWSQRAAEFGRLRVVQSAGGAVVAMEFAPSCVIDEPAPVRWQLWRRLAVRRNILEVVDDSWLRYAALDWRSAPLVLDNGRAAARLATWAAALSWVGEHLLRSVPADRLGWLASPIVKLDLEGVARRVSRAGSHPAEMCAGGGCALAVVR